MRGDAAGGGRDVELRELAAHGLSGEQDLLAVGRPAGHVVVEGVVGDFGQRATGGGDNPDVAIVAVVVFVAGAVGNERDAGAVGRPLRIEIVPIVAAGELLIFAGGGVDEPEVAAPVVEPAGVVELVGDVLVVADVAFARVGRDVVAGAGAGKRDEAGAVGRPLEGGHAIFQMAHHLSFAAGHREGDRFAGARRRFQRGLPGWRDWRRGGRGARGRWCDSIKMQERSHPGSSAARWN